MSVVGLSRYDLGWYGGRSSRPRGEMESVKTEDGPGQIAGNRQRRRLLVVEDDDALRAHTTESLRELGYRVLEADGAAAQKYWRRIKASNLCSSTL